MTIQMTRFAFRVCVLALASVTAAWAADDAVERGRDLAYTCAGCHGIPGYANVYPSYRVPLLGGQHAAYIETALKAYKSGDRPHPTMRAQASSFSDADIKAIAAYVAQAPVHDGDVDVIPPGDPAKGEELSASCVACHGETGASGNAAFPILAGQHPGYLAHTLKAYRSGKRKNAIMNGQAANLSDADIKHLSAWYASQNEPLYTPDLTK